MTEFLIPRLENLKSQPEAEKLLKGLLDNQGVQSFLWTGPEGSGKKTHALALTRSLFCKEGPNCSGCATCKQVLNKTHPDLFWVDREHFWTEDDKDRTRQGIIVDVSKHLERKLNQAPFSAPFKVAIIPDADALNKDAQNVLLKTLEEPPANTLIILIAEKGSEFLPTVLSRCRLIRFPALPGATVESVLIQSYGWEKAKAKSAALESNGNMVLALKSGDEHWTAFRDKVCADMDQKLQGFDEDWLGLVSEYDQWEPDFLGEVEMTATQRKAKVWRAVLQVYLGLWSRRLMGETAIPAKLSTLPADQVLKSLQKHQDMIPSNLGTRMIADHLFLELREGFKMGAVDGRSFMELSVQI
jgi:hypothetical protein